MQSDMGLARGAEREVVWAQGVIGDGHRHQEHGRTRGNAGVPSENARQRIISREIIHENGIR